MRALGAHRVAYVMIGALAARLYGFPRVTADIDITPEGSPDNLERLAASLRELDAKVYTESVPEGLEFDCSAKALGRAALWNLVTGAGRLDIVFTPAGTDGYTDLSRSAAAFAVFDNDVAVASLPDIIRSKMAADRPQDRQDVPVLQALLARDE